MPHSRHDQVPARSPLEGYIPATGLEPGTTYEITTVNGVAYARKRVPPQTFTFLSCYDCACITNRPVVETNTDLGPDKAFEDYLCPECSASMGAWIEAVEVGLATGASSSAG